jgi:hypothetical protein
MESKHFTFQRAVVLFVLLWLFWFGGGRANLSASQANSFASRGNNKLRRRLQHIFCWTSLTWLVMIDFMLSDEPNRQNVSASLTGKRRESWTNLWMHLLGILDMACWWWLSWCLTKILGCYLTPLLFSSIKRGHEHDTILLPLCEMQYARRLNWTPSHLTSRWF